jgi:hypothetical protein
MAVPPRDVKPQHLHVLDRARELAEQVRKTAERVHEQAKESHRLTEIARRHSKRGRELSKIGREEARAAQASITWSLDIAHKAGRRSSGTDED